MKKLLKPVLICLVLYFVFSWMFDTTCDLSGCEREGEGWKTSYTLVGKSIADGGCYDVPCRPVGSTGGYCSKNHALKGM